MAGDELWIDGFGLPALDGIVECSATWNGSLVIGGQFTQVGGVPASNVALWDGSRWMPLAAGLNEEVMSLQVFEGNLVASGRFTASGQTEAAGVAMWNGASWQALGGGFDVAQGYLPMVTALTVYRNELVATGEFTRAGATALRRIARWNGTTWGPVGDGLNGRALALAVLGDSLYAGGSFDSAGASQAIGLARWDGSAWSAPFGGLKSGDHNGTVYSLAVLRDHLIVGGEFDSAGGNPMRNIASLSGDQWAPLAGGVHARVTCMAVREDTLFTGLYYGSEGILKWNGASWAWTAPMPYGYALTLLPQGPDLIVGGAFRADSPAGSIAGFNIARWTGQGWSGFETWSNTMHGLSSLFGGSPFVQSLAVYRGQVTAGGFIGLAGEPPEWMQSGTITAWDGEHWHDVLPQSFFGQAYSLLSVGDTLYAAGSLSSGYPYLYGKTPAFRFDGAIWSAMDTLSATGTSLVLYNGSLFLGVRPTGYPGPQLGGLYRWTGTRWELVGATESAHSFSGVTSMVVHGGKLVVAGIFERIGGVPALNVASWSGTDWEPLAYGLQSDWNGVTGLTEWNGALVAGGTFYNLPGGPSAAARWDEISWSRLGALDGVAYSIRGVAGRLFAGGWFGSLLRQHVQGLLEWDGTDWIPLGSGLNGPVYSIAQQGSNLIVGGSFTLAGGKSSFGIAEWRGLTSAPQAPRVAQISSNHPNPFAGSTSFSLDLPQAGLLRVSIHDMVGREVTVLEDGYQTAGSHLVSWNGRDASGRGVGTGIFFVRAALPDGIVLARKMLRLK